MFEIKITGISEAGGLIQDGWPTRIVSFLDTVHEGGRWIEPQSNHLITYADDCEHDVQAYGLGYIAPRREQVQKILDFTKDLEDTDILLVHCHAGVSRSAAMAIGICIQHGMSVPAALQHIEGIRKQLFPNALIIQFVDEILDLRGELIQRVQDWKDSKRGEFLNSW